MQSELKKLPCYNCVCLPICVRRIVKELVDCDMFYKYLDKYAIDSPEFIMRVNTFIDYFNTFQPEGHKLLPYKKPDYEWEN